jgi:hypothetical protein
VRDEGAARPIMRAEARVDVRSGAARFEKRILVSVLI